MVGRRTGIGPDRTGRSAGSGRDKKGFQSGHLRKDPGDRLAPCVKAHLYDFPAMAGAATARPRKSAGFAAAFNEEELRLTTLRGPADRRSDGARRCCRLLPPS